MPTKKIIYECYLNKSKLFGAFVLLMTSYVWFYCKEGVDESVIIREMAAALSVMFPLIFVIPPIILTKYDHMELNHISSYTILYFLFFIGSILTYFLMLTCEAPHLIVSLGVTEHSLEFAYFIFFICVCIMINHLISFFVIHFVPWYTNLTIYIINKSISHSTKDKINTNFLANHFNKLLNLFQDLLHLRQYDSLSYFIKQFKEIEISTLMKFSNRYSEKWDMILQCLYLIGTDQRLTRIEESHYQADYEKDAIQLKKYVIDVIYHYLVQGKWVQEKDKEKDKKEVPEKRGIPKLLQFLRKKVTIMMGSLKMRPEDKKAEKEKQQQEVINNGE